MAMGANGSAAEINVTPLIDVLLVLLVIFMVITPMQQRGLESQVPQPAKEQQTEVALPQVVALRAVATEGAAVLSLNGESVTRAELQGRLRGAYGRSSSRQLIVESDAALPYSAAVQVVALGREAGAEQVGLRRVQ